MRFALYISLLGLLYRQSQVITIVTAEVPLEHAVCACVCARVCVRVCVRVYACVCVLVHVCVF